MQQMLTNLRARREDERGFTLIELMVVVLIIAILIAIAIPTFLGAKSRAQDKAAQSSLRNGLTNAKGVYTDQDTYGTSAALTSSLILAEPSLTFSSTAASASAKQIEVVTGGTAPQSWVVMVAKSADGNCYAIGDSNTFGTAFKYTTSGNCDTTVFSTGPTAAPTSAAATAGGAWASSW
jgi:prepilin-type N-terminal cleavage/methylation domain